MGIEVSVSMTYISRSSDFALYLEDYLMGVHHYLGLSISMIPAVSKTKSLPLCNFKTVRGIFMKLHTNISLGDVQSARNITLVLRLFELHPFELFK